MKAIYFIIFLYLSILPSFGQEELDRYLLLAAQNNAGLKSAFNEYMAALEKIPQSSTLPNPSVAFGYFIQPVETRLGPQQAKLSVSQMFPWFGTLAAYENSSRSMAKSKYELFEETKSKLFYEVKTTYYNLFFNEKAIDITRSNIEILNTLKSLVNTKIESGNTSVTDAYSIEMEINDMENQLALLLNNSEVLKTMFNRILNTDNNSEIDITDSLTDKILLNKQALLDSILLYNKALSAFDYQIEELHYRQKAATKEGMPQISLGMEYAFIGTGNSSDNLAGRDAFIFPLIGISVPLYRKKYNAKIQEIGYLENASINQKTEKQNKLTILFEETWKDYLDAVRRIELNKIQKVLSEKSLEILESDYATGNLDFEEILRMEQKLLRYKLEHQKAITDKQSATAFIDYLQGK